MVNLDITKSRLDLLMEANKYVKDISNVNFAFSNTNCRLKVGFRIEEKRFLIQWRI